MRGFFIVIIDFFIVGLFLYSKLLPYKAKLGDKYIGLFNFFNSIFTPIFNFMKSVIKPTQVGIGLAVDMTQIILLILFLLTINLI